MNFSAFLGEIIKESHFPILDIHTKYFRWRKDKNNLASAI